MRRLAALALFALTATTLVVPTLVAGDEFDRIVIRDGDSTYMTGAFESTSSARIDVAAGTRHYAWFERDGETWLITDASVLAQLKDATRPQRDLGALQSDLGRKQADLGRKQADLGRKQADLGRMHASYAGDSDRQRELSAKQRELTEQQRGLSDRQRELSAKQRELSERQREASRDATRAIEKIFEDALRDGTAKRR